MKPYTTMVCVIIFNFLGLAVGWFIRDRFLPVPEVSSEWRVPIVLVLSGVALSIIAVLIVYWTRVIRQEFRSSGK